MTNTDRAQITRAIDAAMTGHQARIIAAGGHLWDRHGCLIHGVYCNPTQPEGTRS